MIEIDTLMHDFSIVNFFPFLPRVWWVDLLFPFVSREGDLPGVHDHDVISDVTWKTEAESRMVIIIPHPHWLLSALFSWGLGGKKEKEGNKKKNHSVTETAGKFSRETNVWLRTAAAFTAVDIWSITLDAVTEVHESKILPGASVRGRCSRSWSAYYWSGIVHLTWYNFPYFSGLGTGTVMHRFGHPSWLGTCRTIRRLHRTGRCVSDTPTQTHRTRTIGHHSR